MQANLWNLLAARPGHFRLESGHHGDLWLDLDHLFLRPSQVTPLAHALAQRLAPYGPAAICGPLTGGALLAEMIAVELGLEFFYTERYVLSQSGDLYPAGYRLPAGLRSRAARRSVAVVDDVINAGSAVRGTLAALAENGAQPVVVGALLVLGTAEPGFLAGEHLPLESLAQHASNLWTPADCPLCAAGDLLEDLSN